MISKDELEDIRKSYVFGNVAILRMPLLLDEIERLQEELERVEQQLAAKDVEGVCNLCGKRFPSSAF